MSLFDETPDLPGSSSWPEEALIALVGLDPADRDALRMAIRRGPIAAITLELDSLAEACSALDVSAELLVVVVGAGGAVSGWDASGDALRRVVPNAALVALTDAPLATAEAGSPWNDVLRSEERDPLLLARVLRSGLAIARAQARLARWALRDPLTDLLNRRGLERVLLRESSAGERGHGASSALLVDCDDFKRINDQFGLAMGDDVLRKVADALSRSVRSGDTVGRVGGDEFLVLLPHTRVWEAVEVADRIRREVRNAVRLPDGGSLTVSIGVRRLDHFAPHGRPSLRAVVEATQEGLAESKREGKDQVRVVDRRGGSSPAGSSARQEGVSRRMLSIPPSAWEPGALDLQVARDLVTGAPALAVVRLSSPESPIRIATMRASQPEVDLEWLRAELGAVTAAMPHHVRIFPNTVMSAPASPALADQLLSWLPVGVPPQAVALAIDDQYLSGEPWLLVRALAPLREAGFPLALDTGDLGRSCLEALILLRPERIVLDPGLVRGASGSRVKPAELSRLVRVCEALQIGVVAGDVSSEADRQALLQIGIRTGIGAPADSGG